MNFTEHPTNNRNLGAPAGWDQQAMPCTSLPVTLHEDPAVGPVWVSYWKPSEAERSAIAAGALIELTIFGGGHPPVALSVEGVQECGGRTDGVKGGA
jgi:hypothetical protein